MKHNDEGWTFQDVAIILPGEDIMVYDKHGYPLATVRAQYDTWNERVSPVEAAEMDAQTFARARLIATAPELLEFIREWLDRQGGDANYMTEKASALIAKATS